MPKKNSVKKKEQREWIRKEAIKENKIPGKDGNSKDKGYLSKSINVIKQNPWTGVGYVSNVSAGDSMLIHLLVRGGIAGISLFMFFLMVLSFIIYKNRSFSPEEKSLAEGWLTVMILFFVFGINLPTFIQDRTSDVFWCFGALLANKAILHGK